MANIHLGAAESACADHLHLVVEPWNFLLKKGSEDLGVYVGFLRFGSIIELLEGNTIPHTNEISCVVVLGR